MNARVSGRLFRILVAVALTTYLLFRSDPRAVAAAIATADLRLAFVAIGLTLLDRTLMACRWIGLLCIVDPASRPPFRRLMEIFFVSTFLGTFLPASVGGDAVRAYRLSRENVSGGDAVASVFMDRMLGVASLLMVAVPGVFLARRLSTNSAVIAALLVTAGACAATVLLVFSPRFAALAGRLIAATHWPRLHRASAAVIGSVQSYARFHARLLGVLAASVGVQVLRIVQAYFLGRAVGIDAGLGAYFAFVPLILLVMLLPLTINGLGTSQAAFVWFFGTIGVGSAPAFALSALFVGLQIVGNLPGALLYAFPGVRSARQGAVGLLFIACLAAGLGAAGCVTAPAERPTLTQLYTPTFAPPPVEAPARDALSALASQLRIPESMSGRPAWLPTQGGVLWLSLVVTLMVAFDFRHPANPRNVDLLLMQAIGWCFFDILGFLDRLDDPVSYKLMDLVFAAVMALTVSLLVRALWRVRLASGVPWTPGLGKRALATLAATLLVLDVAVGLYSPPDDAGYFVNIGGQRLRETGRWPYGDPLLTGTPAAAYGPVLYAAHVPFQFLLSPLPMNPATPDRTLASLEPYFLPRLLATKLTTITLHLLGTAALFAAARRLAGGTAAWAVVALYCGSAFVLGVGGGDYSIGGITFTSHIGPAALSLVAFAMIGRPAWSGVALAASIGALFYPVFFVPAWIGFYWSKPRQLRAFVVGFALACAVIAGSVLVMSRAAHGRSRISTIVYDTIGHQESPAAYGSSPFGFWGQRAGVRGWLMAPLAADRSMTRPVVLAFFLFAAGGFVLARGRTPAQLALVIAAIAMGAQLWKIHATATYVTWYYPFLLLGVFCESSQHHDTADV